LRTHYPVKIDAPSGDGWNEAPNAIALFLAFFGNNFGRLS
jgi:hypothetical protein